MNDHSRMLIAIGAIALGPAFGGAGSYLLGTARAVARHTAAERRRRADLGQYAAALLALTGFLLLAGGAGLLVAELVPGTEPVQIVSAAVTGVLVFAVAGVVFSRLADAAEESRVRRMPRPVYAPARPQRPAALPAPVSAPPIRQPIPVPALPAPMPAVAAAPPAAPSAEIAQIGPAAPGASSATLKPSSSAPLAVPGSPANTWFGHTDAPPQLGEPSTTAATTGEDPPADASDVGEAAAELTDPADLSEHVRPGWIYQDQGGRWYLGVGSATGALLRLPEFTLAACDEPSYPLVIAGAGEIAVVPLDDDAQAST